MRCLPTLSGAAVAWSSTPRSSGGVSRVAGAASCLSSETAAAAGYRSVQPAQRRRRRPGHLPEARVPEMGHPALAELPDLYDGDPQRIASDGEHHRVEVAVADHQSDPARKPADCRRRRSASDVTAFRARGDVLAQRSMDLRYDAEGQRVLYGAGRTWLQQRASRQAGSGYGPAAAAWPGIRLGTRRRRDG